MQRQNSATGPNASTRAVPDTSRVVVLRALGLGDLLTVVPALRALRRAFPASHIALATPAALGPLALHTGAMDEVVDAKPLAALPAQLHRADVAVNLHGRGPQSVELLQAAAPCRLISFGVPDGPTWRADEHEVTRWCRLLTESGIPADPDDLDVAVPNVEPPVRRAVVVHPGAAQQSRRWPAERWAEVARRIAAAGEHVVLTGSPAEESLARGIARAAGLPPDRVLAGTTDLLSLAALIAHARLLVSPDTGVAHLATALGTPSVVLFGPTPPALWGPPVDRPRHRTLWAGRTGDNFAETPDRGLLEISIDQVVAEALDALSGGRG